MEDKLFTLIMLISSYVILEVSSQNPDSPISLERYHFLTKAAEKIAPHTSKPEDCANGSGILFLTQNPENFQDLFWDEVRTHFYYWVILTLHIGRQIHHPE